MEGGLRFFCITHDKIFSQNGKNDMLIHVTVSGSCYYPYSDWGKGKIGLVMEFLKADLTDIDGHEIQL